MVIKKVLNCIAAFLVTIGSLACCSSDSGDRITRIYDLTDFSALDVSHAFEVEVIPSDEESVTVVFSANMEKYLAVEKRGSTLCIGLKKNYVGWFRANPCLKAYVSCKTLKSVSASGASDVEIKGIYDALGQNLAIELSGASSFDGHVLNVNRLMVDVSGASKLELDGNGNGMDLEASGASKTDLEGFPVKAFVGDVSGASKAELYVTETFEAEASGASKIKVKGHPSVVKAEESGASTICFE